jgi:hypothetical protein
MEKNGATMTKSDPPSSPGAAFSRTALIDGMSHLGLALLSRAFAYARDAGGDVWDFALEIDRLFEAGLTISDLRWLVAKGFVDHGQESSVYGSPHRSFRRGDGFSFDPTTCVVLTPRGSAFVAQCLNAPVVPPLSISPIETMSLAEGETPALDDGLPAHSGHMKIILVPSRPCWNSSRRELSLDGVVVKRYRVPAHNQELILSAFEEEGWPEHIDDPLPVSHEIDPHTRLHDAINRLNRCQTNRLLRFHGNGSGTGVFWDLRRTKAGGSLSSKPRAMGGDWPRADLGGKPR